MSFTRRAYAPTLAFECFFHAALIIVALSRFAEQQIDDPAASHVFTGFAIVAQGEGHLLTRNHRQESLSRAYVQAIAARAGMSCSFREFDYGIDVSVHDIRRKGRRYAETGYNLDIQAKSTNAAPITETVIQYDLDVKNYHDLRDPEVGCPRILVLLILPVDESQWTEQMEEHLLLRRAAYWVSLKGRESSTNSRTVRVELPRSNLFTIDALQALMQRVRRRQAL